MKTIVVNYLVKYRKNDNEKIHQRHCKRAFTYRNEKELLLQIMNDLLMMEIVSEIISLEIELEKTHQIRNYFLTNDVNCVILYMSGR